MATNWTITSGNGESMTWIGAYSPWQNLTYIWIDGTEMDFQYWADGEPNRSGGGAQCGELLSVPDPIIWSDTTTYYWKWNDLQCFETLRSFVCKRPYYSVS
jgi:hypothetical protein